MKKRHKHALLIQSCALKIRRAIRSITDNRKRPRMALRSRRNDKIYLIGSIAYERPRGAEMTRQADLAC